VHTFALPVLTGFLAAAAHYAAMYAIVSAGGSGVPASATGFLLGALTRFGLSYRHLFAPTRSVGIASARFVVAVVVAQLATNSALFAALLAEGVPLWPAQATRVALTVGNYLAYQPWVFG
jgi:putative flippase GtrA